MKLLQRHFILPMIKVLTLNVQFPSFPATNVFSQAPPPHPKKGLVSSCYMLLNLSIPILGICCTNKGAERVPRAASGKGGGDCRTKGREKQHTG